MRPGVDRRHEALRATGRAAHAAAGRVPAAHAGRDAPLELVARLRGAQRAALRRPAAQRGDADVRPAPGHRHRRGGQGGDESPRRQGVRAGCRRSGRPSNDHRAHDGGRHRVARQAGQIPLRLAGETQALHRQRLQLQPLLRDDGAPSAADEGDLARREARTESRPRAAPVVPLRVLGEIHVERLVARVLALRHAAEKADLGHVLHPVGLGRPPRPVGVVGGRHVAGLVPTRQRPAVAELLRLAHGHVAHQGPRPVRVPAALQLPLPARAGYDGVVVRVKKVVEGGRVGPLHRGDDLPPVVEHPVGGLPRQLHPALELHAVVRDVDGQHVAPHPGLRHIVRLGVEGEKARRVAGLLEPVLHLWPGVLRAVGQDVLVHNKQGSVHLHPLDEALEGVAALALLVQGLLHAVQRREVHARGAGDGHFGAGHGLLGVPGSVRLRLAKLLDVPEERPDAEVPVDVALLHRIDLAGEPVREVQRLAVELLARLAEQVHGHDGRLGAGAHRRVGDGRHAQQRLHQGPRQGPHHVREHVGRRRQGLVPVQDDGAHLLETAGALQAQEAPPGLRLHLRGLRRQARLDVQHARQEQAEGAVGVAPSSVSLAEARPSQRGVAEGDELRVRCRVLGRGEPPELPLQRLGRRLGLLGGLLRLLHGALGGAFCLEENLHEELAPVRELPEAPDLRALVVPSLVQDAQVYQRAGPGLHQRAQAWGEGQKRPLLARLRPAVVAQRLPLGHLGTGLPLEGGLCTGPPSPAGNRTWRRPPHNVFPGAVGEAGGCPGRAPGAPMARPQWRRW
eukprot:16439589-Heterocapsa_arctica.AAC.2